MLVSALEEQARAKLVEVVVTSDPAGAAVTVDGGAQPTGTPLKLRLAAGTHALKLTLDRHQSVPRSIEVVAGKRNAFVVALKPEQARPPVVKIEEPAADDAEADAEDALDGDGTIDDARGLRDEATDLNLQRWIVVGAGAAIAGAPWPGGC